MNKKLSEAFNSLPVAVLPQHVVLIIDGNRRWTKKLWPDFGPRDFLKAVTDYTKRGRRFGK